MLPAKPPFPLPWNFPFQPALGIHTSNLISESAVGLITPVTRQKAGRSLKRAPLPAAVAKEPAFTGCAEVIVVFASFKSLNFSQVCADAGPAPEINVVSKATTLPPINLCGLPS